MRRAARLHRAAHARRDRRRSRTASTRPRARSTSTATPTSRCALKARVEIDRRRRRASTSAGSDPQRRAPVNSTYAQTFSACAYAVKCLIDPDLPVNDGFYRARQRRRAEGHGHELHLAEPGRRRLGDADAARRRDLPGAAAGAARAAAGGHEGDDVPRGLRRCRRADGRVLLLPRDVRRRLRRPRRQRRAGRRADARAEHRERARRGDRAELSGARRAPLAGRGLGRPGPLPRRPRPAQGLRLRPRDDVHGARRPHARRPGGRVRRSCREAGGVRADPRRRGDAARREDDDRGRSRATRSAIAPAAAAATGRRWSATPSASPATSARARSVPSERGRSTDGRRAA